MKKLITYSAIIAVSIVLMAACQGVFNADVKSAAAPQQRGLLIDLGGLAQRTLLPTPTFDRFEIQFVWLGQGSQERDDEILDEGQTSVLIDDLVNGLWGIHVTGFIYDEPLAEGYNEINVNSSSFQGLTIILEATEPFGADDGFFDYTVSFPHDLINYAYLEIYGFSNGYGGYFDVYNSNQDRLYLLPGYYFVTVYVYPDEGKPKTKSEVVHIYSNMPTVGDFVFTEYDIVGDVEKIFLGGTVNLANIGVPLELAGIGIFLENSWVGSASINIATGAWQTYVSTFNTPTLLQFGIYVRTVSGEEDEGFLGTWVVHDYDIDNIHFTFGQTIHGGGSITLSGVVDLVILDPFDYANIHVYLDNGDYAGAWAMDVDTGAWQVPIVPLHTPMYLYFYLEFETILGEYDEAYLGHIEVYNSSINNISFSYNDGKCLDCRENPCVCPLYVTSNANSGAGSLRQAIADAASGGTIVIEDGVGTINLTSGLAINKSLTIRGNGVTIATTAVRLLQITRTVNNDLVTVHISDVHFTGGRVSDYGAAINNANGSTLLLESCIFSNNIATSGSSQGGAISCAGTLIVRGCTFYNNSSGSWGGGAIDNTGGSVTMLGNLFYGNTSTSTTAGRSRVLAMNGGTYNASGSGYNVVDIAFGTAAAQAGWVAASTDRLFSALGISGIPFRTATFVPFNNAINMLPGSPLANFPDTDFYGNDRIWPGAPGAVNFDDTPDTIDIAAIQGITVPVVGFAPITLINETDQYTGAVTWNPDHTVFEAGIPYTATITLTAKDGFTVLGVAENFFTVANAESAANAANSGIITAVFPAAFIPTVMVSRDGGAVTGYETLTAALDAITAAGSYMVTVKEDQLLAPRTINTADVHITFVGEDGERMITHSGTAGQIMFTISNTNTSLTLGNDITLRGLTSASSTSLINITNGRLIMQTGSRITRHTTSSANGAIYVNGLNARLIMEGGEISGNSTTAAATGTAANGGVSLNDGYITMSGGSITGNTHNTIPADVYVIITVADRFTMSGSATVGALKLFASGATTRNAVTIAGPLTGSVASLHLRRAVTAIADVISAWEDQPVLRAAAGYTLTADDVAQFTLGNFMSSATSSNTQAINDTHLIADSGMDIGRLILIPIPPAAQFAYYWVNEQGDGEIAAISSSTLSRSIGQSLIIDAIGPGYTGQIWYLNGVNTGQTGETFVFSSFGRANGDYDIGLLVFKDGRYYNMNFTVTVTN